MAEQQPTCYVIAGPNGAGKTTFALRYLATMTGCANFINADLIAAGLSPLDPAKAQLEAGRILSREIRAHIEKRVDFAFETTLSGRTYVRLLRKIKAAGWKTILFYLWIPSARFSAARVRQRVESGGHDIPADAIQRRYARTVSNFLNVFAPLCDEVMCYDSSEPKPVLAFERRGEERVIVDEQRCEMIERSIHG